MRPIALVLPLLILGACQQAAPKAASVEQAWVRLPAVADRPGAAYFTLHGGAVDDRLMAVSSPQAVKAEMHDMSMDAGMMKMAPIEGGLSLPAKSAVTFATGGKHVMLYDISPKVTAGTKLTLIFTLASGGTLEAQADVVAPGGDDPHGH